MQAVVFLQKTQELGGRSVNGHLAWLHSLSLEREMVSVANLCTNTHLLHGLKEFPAVTTPLLAFMDVEVQDADRLDLLLDTSTILSKAISTNKEICMV